MTTKLQQLDVIKKEEEVETRRRYKRVIQLREIERLIN